jgi:hypothetical protein
LDQLWIDKNGWWVCEQLAKDPTDAGLSNLVGSMVMYYELGGRSGQFILGSVAQLCPQYSHLIPALSGPR